MTIHGDAVGCVDAGRQHGRRPGHRCGAVLIQGYGDLDDRMIRGIGDVHHGIFVVEHDAVGTERRDEDDSVGGLRR